MKEYEPTLAPSTEASSACQTFSKETDVREKKRLWRALEYEHVIPPLDDSSKLITEYSGEQMAFLRNQTSSEGIDKIIATLFCGKGYYISADCQTFSCIISKWLNS